MIAEEEIRLIKSWIDYLVGKRLNYISGRNFFVIESADWSGNGKIVVIRNNDQKLTISFDNFETVLEQLNTGKPVHVDSVLRGGGELSNSNRNNFCKFSYCRLYGKQKGPK